VRSTKRSVSTAVAIIALPLAGACASRSGLDDNATAIAALQAKTNQAKPRDRCYLYAELVSQVTDLASKQLSSGESGHALESLTLVQQYADETLRGIADDSKKLKEAELLMQHTSFRLKDILHEASNDDRPALEETLKELYHVQAQLMMQVFKK
jgi:hypothetical protein